MPINMSIRNRLAYTLLAMIFLLIGFISAQIDLSISLEQNPLNPSDFSNFETTVVVNNDSNKGATGVVIRIPKPNDVVYRGGDEYSSTLGYLDIYGADEGT